MTLLASIRAALEQGDLGEAEELARQSLDIDPEDALLHAYLGSILMQRGDHENALPQFEIAVSLEPKIAAFHNEFGNALAFTGDLVRAETALRKAVSLSPDIPEIHNNLGNILRATGQYASAIESYRLAVALRADYAEARTNLGVALQETDDLDGAREAYESALKIDPENEYALTHLGVVLATGGDLIKAEEAHRRALSIAPDLAAAYSNLGIVLKDQGRLEEAEEAYRSALELEPNDPGLHSNLLLAMCFRPDIEEKALFAGHRAFGERFEVSNEQHFTPSAEIGQRLKIGYLSPDFYSHSVASFIEPVLHTHDRSKFHVTCYSDLVVGDEVTARLKGVVDEWRDVAQEDDAALIARIVEDEIDILVDLAGHTGGNRLAVFAHRAAPVQVTWIGYPATTGLAQMDYRLTDQWADPPGTSDQWHSETLYRVEGGFLCYRAPHDAPQPGQAMKRAAPVFGSFNNLSKINAQVIDTWARLLQTASGSRLLLKSRQLADSEVRTRLIQAFEDRSIAAERLDLRARVASRAEHLAMYNEVDVALDTFPYNGTTTTCEALWMGVPVVAMAGIRHAGRVTQSLLTRAGWEEWVADSAISYIGIAQRLGEKKPTPEQVRAQFEASPVMDAELHIRLVETGFTEMWKRYLAGAE